MYVLVNRTKTQRKGGSPTIRIITYPTNLEKAINHREITTIETPSEAERRDLAGEGFAISYRYYSVTCYGKVITLVCAECRRDGEVEFLCLPDFFVPHRPYPIYVYLFAINLYSSDEHIGQRDVAKRTKEKFTLPTFAHTTLGRALKAFVRTIETVNESVDAANANNSSAAKADTRRSGTAGEDTSSPIGHAPEISRPSRFPSAADTAPMRAKAREFIGGRLTLESGKDFVIAAESVVAAWIAAAGRLILTNRVYFVRSAPDASSRMRPP